MLAVSKEYGRKFTEMEYQHSQDSNIMDSAANIVGMSSLSRIEESCRIVVETLQLVSKHIAPGVTTLELDAIAEDYIRTRGGEPAFKGYRGFPNSLCISVESEVVHGIPSKRKLQAGEIVSVDCGVKKNGFFGDAARTFGVGAISEEKQRLLDVTEKSLELGVQQAIARNKVYDISRAVQTYVESNGFSVVRELTGHGVGKRLHEDPSIPNFVPPLLYRSQYPNVKLQRGQTLAIEPMVNAGTLHVFTADDGWTILTTDNQPSAHFEHTVVVEEGKPVILTLWN